MIPTFAPLCAPLNTTNPMPMNSLCCTNLSIKPHTNRIYQRTESFQICKHPDLYKPDLPVLAPHCIVSAVPKDETLTNVDVPAQYRLNNGMIRIITGIIQLIDSLSR